MSRASYTFLTSLALKRWAMLPTRPSGVLLLVAPLLLVSTSLLAATFQTGPVATSIAGGVASAGDYQVTDLTGQPWVGLARSTDYSIDPGFWPTVGSPPVPALFMTALIKNRPAVISFDDILLNATDPDGDPLKIVAVTPMSSQGGSVTYGSNLVTYTSPVDFSGLDVFTYTVVDAGGDSATGSVTVQVGAGEAMPPRVIYGPVISEGKLVVRYAGVPGGSYTVEFTDVLAPAHWQKLFNVIAPAAPGDYGSGVFEVRHQLAAEKARFFRAVSPAY